jgi:hypothetical protein
VVEDMEEREGSLLQHHDQRVEKLVVLAQVEDVGPEEDGPRCRCLLREAEKPCPRRP